MAVIHRLAAAVAIVVALVPVDVAVTASQSRPLPDADAFFAATRENLSRATKQQHLYAYKERRTELHMNPFGRIGTDGVRVYEVTPTADAEVYMRRLLEKDGAAVAGSKPERVDRRRRAGGRSSVDDTVAALRFTIDRRDTVTGRDAILVRFEPRPGADPQTREGKLAKNFRGTIWVDEAAREVTRVEATAMDSVSYGLGLIARLDEGTHVTLTRERVDDQIWLPTSIRFVGHGRALLVRKLNVDFAVEWFEYKRVR